MPSPFPGMDPYLEDPGTWEGFHTRLIVTLRDELLALLRPKYWVAIEARVYNAPLPGSLTIGLPGSIGKPDVSVVREPPPEVEYAASRSRTALTLEVDVPMPVEIKEHYLEV